MTPDEVEQMVRQGRSLAEQPLFRLDLRGRDLSGAELAGATLTGVQLEGANLRGSNLAGALFGAYAFEW